MDYRFFFLILVISNKDMKTKKIFAIETSCNEVWEVASGVVLVQAHTIEEAKELFLASESRNTMEEIVEVTQDVQILSYPTVE